jgi:hypothetical protein
LLACYCFVLALLRCCPAGCLRARLLRCGLWRSASRELSSGEALFEVLS